MATYIKHFIAHFIGAILIVFTLAAGLSIIVKHYNINITAALIVSAPKPPAIIETPEE